VSRPRPQEPACPSCGSGLGIEEGSSRKTARAIHACAACGKRFAASHQGAGLFEETAVSDTAGGTLRLRAVPPGPRPAAEALPEGMTIALEVGDGPARGRVFHVNQRMVVLGREEGEIQIPDPMVSRRHATLEIHDMATIILRDLSSTNGTYHNDQLIAFCKIQDGDEIRLGSTLLTVSVDLIG
jgi:hypothetical protein